MRDNSNNFSRLIGFSYILVLVLVAFVAVKTVNEIKRFNYIGEEYSGSENTLTVSGEGEVFAVADIASFNYSVIEEGESANSAGEKATEKWNQILKYLKDEGIKETDIRTINYSVNPKYAPLPPNSPYVPMVERTITGYTVTQTAQVKVRDTGKAGDILSKVGSFGVRNLSGISFTIDDESSLKQEARQKAIKDAKSKAEVLAKDLGVKLVGVANYYEGGYYPYPTYAREESMMMDFRSMADGEALASPELPMGENRIQINVEVTYRIK